MTGRDPARNGIICYVDVGACSTRFLRGDTHNDERVDLSDAVSMLRRLFLGGDALA